MKGVLLILLVLAVIWLWRTKRPGLPAAKKQATPSPQPMTMVSCAHCAVHLPTADAVQGKKEVFCSEKHRQASEG
jgi:uncharacterized protein